METAYHICWSFENPVWNNALSWLTKRVFSRLLHFLQHLKAFFRRQIENIPLCTRNFELTKVILRSSCSDIWKSNLSVSLNRRTERRTFPGPLISIWVRLCLKGLWHDAGFNYLVEKCINTSSKTQLILTTLWFTNFLEVLVHSSLDFESSGLSQK